VTTYWIGGSPCAGKSSVAALLAARHELALVECDAGADRRLARMAPARPPAFAELTDLGTCARLARPPRWQASREVSFYHEQFDFLLEEIPCSPRVLVEGADLLPELLEGIDVPPRRAIWIVPTPEFQLSNYRRRDWVAPYLKDCVDPERALENWMRRDVLFAEHVRREAAARGGTVIVVDGSRTVTEIAGLVGDHFGLPVRPGSAAMP
jgi:hypothetical protein